jgi:hypothetical protein
MKTVVVKGVSGSVFQGEWPGTYCFVPTGALEANAIDRKVYLDGRWGERNFRANNGVSIGNTLLPDLSQPISELDSRVMAFLHRLENDSGRLIRDIPEVNDPEEEERARRRLRELRGDE